MGNPNPNPVYVCLHGLTRHISIPDHKINLQNGYTAGLRCLEHHDCIAVECMWPIEEINTLWAAKNTCQASIIKEATRCFVCDKRAEYTCLYGGHMVCEAHVRITLKKKNKIKSPLQCTCRGESTNPVWPNPFAHLFINDGATVLESNVVDEFSSYKDTNLSIMSPQCNTQITHWGYPKDRHPRTEFIPATANKKRIVAWRIALFPLHNERDEIHLQRCIAFWKSVPVATVLKSVNDYLTKQKEKEKETLVVYRHIVDLFMFIYHKTNSHYECLCCHQRYKTSDSFISSKCCLYPHLNDMIVS